MKKASPRKPQTPPALPKHDLSLIIDVVMSAKKPDRKMPAIAIVGRPNVGKSTLFNRLVGSRRALVDDEPGVTRDRNYALIEHFGHCFRLIDTGGFEPASDQSILRAMRAQTELAIAEADAIVFMLDGREGVTPADREVSLILRRQKKPVFYAVNKIDGPRHDDKLTEFYELGVDALFGVSAEHGYGVAELFDAVVEAVPGLPAAELAEEDPIPRVAVIGRPNAGKSTLINALIGEPRLLVHPQPGTTRDAIDAEVRLAGRTWLFIDTAGMRKKSKIDDRLERFSVMRSLDNLDRCHLAILMVDAIEGLVDQDAKLAGLCHDRGRALILVFNKWDLVENKEKRRRELDDQIQDRLPHVAYAPVITMSAKEGTRIGKLAALLAEVMAEYEKRITTGELNRALEAWTSANPPPSPGGRPIKIYYAAQTRVRPPTFAMITSRPDKIPAAYQRYLVNRLRESFGFTGAPIKVRLKAKKGRDRQKTH